MRLTALLCAGGIALAAAGCGGGTTTEKPAPSMPGAAVGLRAELAQGTSGTVTVAWIFDLVDGWHLYWHGLNDSGYPPTVDLSLPAGWEAGPLRWPVPVRHVMPGGILDHVYVNRLVLLQELTGPGGARPAEATRIEARVRWLACRDACVPGQQVLAITIPGSDVDLPVAPAVAWPALPLPLPDGLAQVRWVGDAVEVVVPGARTLRFFPEADSGPYADLLGDGEADGERLLLKLRRREGAVGPVRGLLQIVRNGADTLTGPLAVPERPQNIDTNHGG